ncbi:hypothetical protein LTR10_023946 [Elasticomyces elasticus]|uniref:Uncharacterized protein n=1 Tax=Exophiala sideris TaxID=1016849 RepID=A0ABR0IV09_9EURO|nr:hypothetical protein LTR10_023946 [Elasticomyces elasticus]KAK5020835.1 hypothetical protein LTS07_011405 [Exophiala sideris]KAK5049157.1 hypothetical protein LTR69_011184 [Exophiala sideris]
MTSKTHYKHLQHGKICKSSIGSVYLVKLKVPQNRRHHESDPEMEKNDLDSNMKDLIPMVGRICTNVSHGKDIEGDRLEDAATFQDYRKGLAVDDGLDYVRNACR